ncbi:DUF2085 domain-containing protein [Umezakia ovalisporum]|jgi:hypothetical protein|uniref:DUF2085 domain-containing protein n=1 Tax=Umezakia ovalisporum FSS-62 TaxID=2971776 RepID=A0AA43KG51_9CYAN|nr:DUF2085 domain-containing protein [Umezakia ovalisporum]MDH6064740.1 DUF2085 domain-containing protein [Umezakia ovalisporum FSS-62]MDH6066473.1 DUF2085 domain-containing protein [Umezakia ovalisporum APH033B]MDH6079259.1 DUF2085 domain-containing protein [Umezakia ovalisporum FSS-45]MDH6084173.1 DUF2085 domain-containing protein [Umezakia ovalisporum TAC611]MDH6101987.1 DUF2085 domain-containing protein [Umezakia ovalisporum ANA283AFssAo]
MAEVVFKEELQVNWVGWFADFLLMGMVFGPAMAPFLAASDVTLLGKVADIIYFMGNHVCPQPNMGLNLVTPFIMAVCMRCYGTVMGLLITRLLYGLSSGKGFYWLSQYGWNGAAVASVFMMAYPLELAAQVFDLWIFNNYVVTLFGLITGLGWGLFTMPILHR